MNILQVKKYYLLIRAEFFAGKITLDNADKDQGDSLNDFVDFNKRAKPRDVEKTNYLNTLYEGREMVLNSFKSGIFPLKPTKGIVNPGMSARIAKVSDRSSQY